MDINELRPLKYVFAAVEHGSMRRAAQAFGVQQSSVSRNIVALEQHLDIQIFDRQSNGVHLTKAGRAWLGEIRAHYEGLQEALSQNTRQNRDEKTLRIGLNSPVGRQLLFRLIRRFETAHPDISITIEDIACDKYATAIRRRTLDVAFISGFGGIKSCLSETIWEERLSVLLPAGHPLAERPALSWTDLAGEQILIPFGRNEAQIHPGFFKQILAVVDRLTIQYCHASLTTLIILAQLGKGITLAGESLANAVSIDRMVWRPIMGKSSAIPISVIWLGSNPKRAALRLVAVARNIATEK